MNQIQKRSLVKKSLIHIKHSRTEGYQYKPNFNYGASRLQTSQQSHVILGNSVHLGNAVHLFASPLLQLQVFTLFPTMNLLLQYSKLFTSEPFCISSSFQANHLPFLLEFSYPLFASYLNVTSPQRFSFLLSQSVIIHYCSFSQHFPIFKSAFNSLCQVFNTYLSCQPVSSKKSST